MNRIVLGHTFNKIRITWVIGAANFVCALFLLSQWVAFYKSTPQLHFKFSSVCKPHSNLAMGNKMINFTDEAIAKIYSYLYWTNSKSCKISHDFGGFQNGWSGLEHIGFRDGMKAVCMESTVVPEPSNCLVYTADGKH